MDASSLSKMIRRDWDINDDCKHQEPGEKEHSRRRVCLRALTDLMTFHHNRPPGSTLLT